MPAKLSVNLNAIAMLRNRRDLPWPSVTGLGRIALAAGCVDEVLEALGVYCFGAPRSAPEVRGAFQPWTELSGTEPELSALRSLSVG